MSFLIVRPVSKLQESLDVFHSSGIRANGLAAINIELSEDKSLPLYIQNNNYDYLVVTSTYAVDWLIKIVDQPSFNKLSVKSVICVGSATQSMMKHCFPTIHSDVAKPESSEGVLKLASLQEISNTSIAIIKGDGGRTLIQQELKNRGASVDVLEVYKRVPNTEALASFTFETHNIQCIIVSSAETLDILFAHYKQNQLKTLVWIVASKRIKDYATTKGIKNIYVSEGASTRALCQSALTLLRTGVVND